MIEITLFNNEIYDKYLRWSQSQYSVELGSTDYMTENWIANNSINS